MRAIERPVMKILKFGNVTMRGDDLYVSGFTFDGEGESYNLNEMNIAAMKAIIAFLAAELSLMPPSIDYANMEACCFKPNAVDDIAPPVAAGSVDTHEFLKQLENYVCTETLGPLVAYIDAWGAQQREAGWIAGRINGARVFENTESAVLAAAERLLRDTVIRAEKAEANEIRLQQLVIEAQDRAEKAEARVKELERALSNGTAKPSLLNSASTLGNNEQS